MGHISYPGDELELFARADRWKSYFADLLRPHIGGDVLEVGAGIGETTAHLLDDRARRWTCLEPDPRLSSRIEERVPAAMRHRVRVVTGTIQDLDPAERFDAVLYIDVLEHIADDVAELRRAAQVLRHDGRLIVLAPAFDFLYSPFDEAIGHHRRYTRRTLARVFPPGMRRRVLRYADSVGFVLSLGNRLLLRRSMPTEKQVAFWDRRVIPISRITDRLLSPLVGRSVIAVFSRS